MDLKRHLPNDNQNGEASLKRHIGVIDEATDPKRICLDSGK